MPNCSASSRRTTLRNNMPQRIRHWPFHSTGPRCAARNRPTLGIGNTRPPYPRPCAAAPDRREYTRQLRHVRRRGTHRLQHTLLHRHCRQSAEGRPRFQKRQQPLSEGRRAGMEVHPHGNLLGGDRNGAVDQPRLQAGRLLPLRGNCPAPTGRDTETTRSCRSATSRIACPGAGHPESSPSWESRSAARSKRRSGNCGTEASPNRPMTIRSGV